jgi:hypothetical protein
MLGPALAQFHADLGRIPIRTKYENDLFDELEILSKVVEDIQADASNSVFAPQPFSPADRLGPWTTPTKVDRLPSDIVRAHCDCPDCPNKRL